eukprot:TRINITY_DN73_c0_g1_i1.p1 TRINITY_DN73_c0_g1~~TRINITY_DN73_c0_g1_i1.p1  ORF type:complete len:582 (-),score=164.37 TRINITY_DN73_c0_g1_i1:165-1799(-)
MKSSLAAILAVSLLLCLCAVGVEADHVPCVGDPIDPTPYEPLPDSILYPLMVYQLDVFTKQLQSSLGQTANGFSDGDLNAFVFTSVVDSVVYFEEANISTNDTLSEYVHLMLDDYGYETEIADWTPTSFTINFIGDAGGVPLFRLFLLDAFEAVDEQRKLVVNTVEPASWDTNLTGAPRVAILTLSAHPKDEDILLAKVVNWFCHIGVEVEVELLAITSETPHIYVHEKPHAFDECVSGTDGCEGDCVDGNIPEPGYTCRSTSGDLFSVDFQAETLLSILQVITTQINAEVLGFRTIIQTAEDFEYVFALDGDQYEELINAAIPLVADVIEDALAPIDPDRIHYYGLDDTIVVAIDNAKTFSVEFTVSHDGSGADRRTLLLHIFELLSLNPDLLDNQAHVQLESVDETLSHETVAVKFIEDSRVLDSGEATSAQACRFALLLFEIETQTSFSDIGYDYEFDSISNDFPSECNTPNDTQENDSGFIATIPTWVRVVVTGLGLLLIAAVIGALLYFCKFRDNSRKFAKFDDYSDEEGESELAESKQ